MKTLPSLHILFLFEKLQPSSEGFICFGLDMNHKLYKDYDLLICLLKKVFIYFSLELLCKLLHIGRV